MAPISLFLGLLASVSYMLLRLVSKAVEAQRQARTARELGCQDVPVEPSRWPLGLDNLRAALRADKAKMFPQHMQKIAERMGFTWRGCDLGQPKVVTSEPRNIQTILATGFGPFEMGAHRGAVFWPLLGNGIFSQRGRAWKHSRELLRPQFTRDQVSDLKLEEQHLQNLMAALDEKLNPDGWTDTVDLQVLFFRLTLDSATEFLLGESAHSQLRNIPGREASSAHDIHSIDFAYHFDRAQAGLEMRGRLGPLYWLYHPPSFRESIRQVHLFMDHYVRRALQVHQDQQHHHHDKGPSKGPPKPGRYVFLDALAEKTQDPFELRSQLLHTLLAGRDTTASMLGWLFYSLARDPPRYRKLRDAVVTEFGTFSRPRGDDITFSRLKACSYLQYCNNETLRLFPVVPFNGRYAYMDMVLPTGGGPDRTAPVFVPKNTPVEYSVYIMHRRQDIWGPDAHDFRPERWEGRKAGWEYLPFNGGPRICLGQQFALTEASYVTVRMLQRFDELENRDRPGDPVVKHHVTLTDCSATGVQVRLHASVQ